MTRAPLLDIFHAVDARADLPQPPSPDSSDILILAVAVLVAAAVYFIPTIIAFRRHKASRAAILAFNLFLGWTFLGRVVALIWALKVDVVDRASSRHAAGNSAEDDTPG